MTPTPDDMRRIEQDAQRLLAAHRALYAKKQDAAQPPWTCFVCGWTARGPACDHGGVMHPFNRDHWSILDDRLFEDAYRRWRVTEPNA